MNIAKLAVKMVQDAFKSHRALEKQIEPLLNMKKSVETVLTSSPTLALVDEMNKQQRIIRKMQEPLLSMQREYEASMSRLEALARPPKQRSGGRRKASCVCFSVSCVMSEGIASVESMYFPGLFGVQ